ncbi:transmembrane protein 70, mitochondrial [Pelodytes ibericus]
MLRFAVCARGSFTAVLRANCCRALSSRNYIPGSFLPVRESTQRSHAPLTQVKLPYVRSVRCVNTTVPVNTEDGRLVYRGNMARTVLGVKFFSYSTSIFTICVMPYVMLKSGIGVDSVALKLAFFSVVGFFTFITPVTLHMITKGYVIRLYRNADSDTYTAVTYNALLAEKRTRFSQKDVEIPGISKMFTTFYAQKKPMLVNPMLFANPQDYSHLMGYDKPFTFNPEDVSE